VRARLTSMLFASPIKRCQNLSIEIFDSGHRKIPFVDRVDSHQIGHVPTESNPIRLFLFGFTMEGRST
jgi:hypothetical protein